MTNPTTDTELRVCANCGNRPEVPLNVVVIVCPICGGKFSTSEREWE